MKLRASTVELVPSVPLAESERLEREDDTPAIGSWWWVFVRDQEEERDDEGEADNEGPSEDVVRDITAPKGRKRRWLGCVTKTGSNFAELEGYRRSVRIALDDFHKRCARVTDPTCYTGEKIAEHRGHVRKLMALISEVCHRLGVPIHQALGEGESAQDSSAALAIVHGVADAKQYQKDLVKAKETTLPETERHPAGLVAGEALLVHVVAALDQMDLLVVLGRLPPADLLDLFGEPRVELDHPDLVLEHVGHALDALELGLGRDHLDPHPPGHDLVVAFHALEHHIKEFDKWLARDENLFRLFPYPRTVIAFRVRHYDRRSDDNTIESFISLQIENRQNKATFLYIRNGNQLWRVETAIEFDEELFPHKADHDLLSDTELWIRPESADSGSDRFILSRRSIDAMRIQHQKKRDFAAWRLRQWHRAGCPDSDEPPWTYTVASGELYEQESHSIRYGGWSSVRGSYKAVPPGGTIQFTGRPNYDRASRAGDPSREYRLLTPEDIYFDDAMAHIRSVTTEHNRIAVIIQGLLSRSTCLHPHPPWEIWKPEGFAQGIELVYDVSRAVTAGDVIDFEAYRAQLNKSIRPGCYTLGQAKKWRAWMVERFGSDWHRYAPGGYGNKGPGTIARVVRVRRNGNCVFEWTRDRARPLVGWEPCPDKPGWRRKTHSYPPIPVRWECEAKHLTCMDAYTPGDYRMFFDDPRTRAQYMKWAPILLSAENWHHKRRLAADQAAQDATAKPKKTSKPKSARKKPKRKRRAKPQVVGIAGLAAAFEADADPDAAPPAPNLDLEGDDGFDDGGDE